MRIAGRAQQPVMLANHDGFTKSRQRRKKSFVNLESKVRLGMTLMALVEH